MATLYTSRSHSTMAPRAPRRSLVLWDPRTVLDICNDRRCVGYAPSQRRKCLNPINQDNMRIAEDIIQKMAKKQPDAQGLVLSLEALASALLCRRNHQSQVDSMVDKWMTMIEEAYPYEDDEEEEELDIPVRHIGSLSRAGRPNRMVETSRTSSVRTSNRAADQQVAEADGAASARMQELVDKVAALERLLLIVTNNQIAQLTEGTAPAQPAAQPAATTTTATHRSPIQTQSSLPPNATSTHSTVAAPSNAGVSSARAGTGATPLQPSSPAPTCTQTHVRRRAIDDECPICREDMSEENALSWCKSSCGNSMHRECFDAWKVSCEAQSRAVRCPVCRGDWSARCPCDA